jgi:hypothetical protein
MDKDKRGIFVEDLANIIQDTVQKLTGFRGED